MKQEHINQIQKAVDAVKGKKVNHFYFVACGGSKALFEPAQYIMDRETDIPCTVYSSNEFVHRAPKALNENSVLVSCSHSGNTPETVKATEIARAAGATTISLSHLVDSPLWNATEFGLHYDWKEEGDAANYQRAILYRLVFSILNALNPNPKYEKAIESVDNLPEVIEKTCALYKKSADEFGSTYKREQLIYTMASGSCYGPAYSFAICLLMEMQWIHSHAIHAGEYFHGPFEATDFDVPFIIIKGIDECRPLDERAYNFCSKYSKKITLIDCADFKMDGIDESVRGYFAPVVLDSVLRDYAEAIADHRGHPLSVRRYMWRMEY